MSDPEESELSTLLGRQAECRQVEQLLREAKAGHSGALVVRGEAGIGKTALLEHLRTSAGALGFRIETSTGIEAETQFAYAGLHQICAPLLDRMSALPEPQRLALGVALGREAGPAPDKFIVGLATLGLLSDAAERSGLLCLVDDAQWLDRASAEVLTFVARRVDAERIAMAFGVRDNGEDHTVFAGLPELRLNGLCEADARALLDSAVAAPLDDDVRDRIIAEARGNPLALLELPTHSRPARLAGGFQHPDVSDIPGRVETEFRNRAGDLPGETRTLLLIAAADPTGDPSLLARAAAHAGIAPESASPAEAAGLIEIGTRVRFRHPLVRSAVYRAARHADRHRAHAALAAATDSALEPDRRAWHAAQAASGFDERIAAELERSAARARARGGSAAAGAFLQRSTELTPDLADRARRALEAAHALREAGAPEPALDLLATAEAGPLDTLQRARVALLRAQIVYHLNRHREAPAMLSEAAVRAARNDPELAREIRLGALDLSMIYGDPIGRIVARAALDDPAIEGVTRPMDRLLVGLATTMVHEFSSGVPALRDALASLRDVGIPDDQPRLRPGFTARRTIGIVHDLSGRIAVGILDDELAHDLTEAYVRSARAAGALAVLPAALSLHANVLIISGEIARARELVAQSISITEATGGVRSRHSETILAAWSGDRATSIRLHDVTLRDPSHPANGAEVGLAKYATAVLYNALGEYTKAQHAAEATCASLELSLSTIGLAELIEASARAGDPDTAANALQRLTARAKACDTAWARGLEARSRALTTVGPSAEAHYREAIAQLEASRIAGEAARAHLVYGEWLRREGRRQDARDALRTAHDLLSAMGAEAFAARAANELRATGERPRKRMTQSTDELTAQELQVARHVVTGATSREVGAQLFLSPRTIEAHLRSIYRKLGIKSRRELREVPLP
ncbi:AAA family ATPase [Myceligenerans xiligouense]|uniref:AAA family ATPase n=1 Tax=Myceligenerans xiligouense TaxID=253184 RepID=UPI001B86D85F|nr:LuxR family transcriptional regulator [Myceligenerans xiligouense]